MQPCWERVRYISPDLSWPGFRIELCDADWMHTVDLGVLAVVIGNCLWDIVLSLHGSYQNWRPAFNRILNMIHAAAKEIDKPSPLSDLTIGMVKKAATAAPCFHAKAAEFRYLLPVMVFMLRHFFDHQSSEYLRLRFQTLLALD